jgi:hypothetical protein
MPQLRGNEPILGLNTTPFTICLGNPKKIHVNPKEVALP